MNFCNCRWVIVGLAAYLVVISLIAFITFGVDKKRARKHGWRIPEKALFLLAILGGSIGAILGMLIFRHKTKKWYFRIGMPLILIAQVCIAVLTWKLLL